MPRIDGKPQASTELRRLATALSDLDWMEPKEALGTLAKKSGLPLPAITRRPDASDPFDG